MHFRHSQMDRQTDTGIVARDVYITSRAKNGMSPRDAMLLFTICSTALCLKQNFKKYVKCAQNTPLQEYIFKNFHPLPAPNPLGAFGASILGTLILIPPPTAFDHKYNPDHTCS